MDKPITLTQFAHFIDLAEKKYPNAKLVSIGIRHSNGMWMYVLILKLDGKEIRYEIPTWEN